MFIDLKKVLILLITNSTWQNACIWHQGKHIEMVSQLPNNRSQLVSYDGIQSTIQSITCGVLQGSILDPLRYIIYMNYIINVSELLFNVLYTDDTSSVIHGKDINSIITIINLELHTLSTWLKANTLSLNTDKTNYIIF